MKINLRCYQENRVIDINTGKIERQYYTGEIYKGSDQWKITGVSIINNFGYQIERLTLNEFYDQLLNNKESLFYKNGKAKFRINDLDHGTNRQWSNVFKNYEVNVLKGIK